MMFKKIFALSFAALFFTAVFLFAAPAHAGGWATVGITEMPDEIYAERPFSIKFMVWQHGNKPVHTLQWDNDRTIPITPQISFGSPQAGEKLTFLAEPANKPGLFTAEITLPAEGEWLWSIAPDPLAGVTEFDPLDVLPRSAAPASEQSAPGISGQLTGTASTLAVAAGVLFAVGIALLAFHSRRTQQPG